MKKTFVWVGAAVLLTHATLAQQAADTTQNVTLDEVVVTANKIAQKQSQTGKVITVINKATLQQNQGKSVAQLLNETAGVTVNGALNNLGTPQVLYTRGASSGRTLVLIDGLPVYDPSLINNEFDLNFLPAGLIERIEIARGAQSTLYGSDAIGGVINIITKAGAANLKPVQADAGISYGSFNTTRSFANVYGRSGKISYQAGYQHVGSAGFSAATDKQARGNFDKDGYAQHCGNARVTYHFGRGTTLAAFANLSDYLTDVDASAFTDDRDFTNDTRNLQTGLVFDLKRKSWNLRVQYAYNDVSRILVNDSGHISGFSKFVRDSYDGKSHFAEVYGSFKLGKYLQLLSGIDYRNARMNNNYLGISSFGPFVSTFEDTSIYLASFYNSLLFEKGNWNMEAGFRLNSHETFGSYTTFTLNPSYKINRQWRVYGSIASGFKAPSLYQLYSFAGTPTLKAEKSYNYEAGLAYTGTQATVRLTGFYRDIKNGLDFDYVNFVYFNSGRQQVAGLEAEGELKLSKKLLLSANYTWLAAEETLQSRLTTKDTTYNYLLKRPEHQLFANLQYKPVEKLTLSVNLLVVSDRRDVGGFQAPDVTLKGYVLAGIAAQYKAAHNLTLFADMQNLFDKKYFDINGYNSMRRNVQGGIRMSF